MRAFSAFDRPFRRLILSALIGIHIVVTTHGLCAKGSEEAVQAKPISAAEMAVLLTPSLPTPQPVLAWGDQGDGTYRNPVLKADFSDPDVLRVGEDYYLVASDFHFVGMQVLRSRDLVNWSYASQVFGRLDLHPRYDAMSAYSQGTWAPTLREHGGRFYVLVCTPHDGLFQWHADSPKGPWSERVTVKAVDGWEDPCPFWDEDGQAYLIHSRLGAGPLILHRMSADGSRLLDDGVEVYRGPVAEGPKLFKRDGWYYISLPEGGVTGGGQTLLRSRSLQGPYERRQVLVNGSPHQGALVDLDSGETWFLGFKSTGFLGRVVHLIPVRWGEDDWPIFGEAGHTVEQARKPRTAGSETVPFKPACSDEFDTKQLGLQWQWNHNPVPEAWSLQERPGWLRLRARPAADLAQARNVLTQKLWDEAGVVETCVELSHLSEGQTAGLSFLSGHAFGALRVTREGGRLLVSAPKGPQQVVTRPGAAERLWLRCAHEGEQAGYAYSMDGRNWEALEGSFVLRFADWKGARFGLFCYGSGDGYADFDYVRYVVRSLLR